MSDLNSIISTSQSQTDLLVESYKATQQTRINTLNDKNSLLQSRQSFYGTLNSRLNNLVSQLDKFKAKSANDNFSAKSITSSDSSFVSASAKSGAIIGSNSVKVDRLASKDVLISDRLSLAGSYGESAGEKTFDITSGDTTKQVKVTFNGTETNEQAIKKIVQAINSTEDIEVNASFVKDTTTSGRLSLNSTESGTENKITFTASTALDKLGLNPDSLLMNTNTRTVTTDTTAGYKQTDSGVLDSKFQLNGINITRSSNSIDDVLDGVTLSLKKVHDTDDDAVTLETSIDSKSVETFVKGLLTAMNDVISNINSNRDVKRNDSAVSNLMQNLKNSALTKFNDNTEDAPKYLIDIGIKFDSNGFLTIADSEDFEDALQADPQKVADLFTGENGLANKVDKLISPFKGSSGLITARTTNIKSQIDSTAKKLADTEARVELQADSLRKQYQSYLKLYYDAQNQSSYLSGFTTT